MLLSQLRVGGASSWILVKVLQEYEGGRYLIADSSASFVVAVGVTAGGAVAVPLTKLSTVLLRVQLLPKSLSLQEVGESVRVSSSGAADDELPVESCGVILRARDTGKLMCIRDYHSPAFMDVQFKMRAAFTEKIPHFPTEELVKEVRLWADNEVRWVVEWKLKEIYPFVTDAVVQGWDRAMKRMGADIKALYRAAKIELERRVLEQVTVPNHGWGFPKGGPKVVGNRLETSAEVALRELREEVGLRLTLADIGDRKFHSVPRAHGESADQFVCVDLPRELPLTPPSWDVAKIEWRELQVVLNDPLYARFRETLQSLA